MIEVKGVSKAFGEKQVLRDFSETFPKGETTCLMGESGSGKTTLLYLLLGFIKPDEGTITGVPGKVSAVFQEDRLAEDFSAVANVRMAVGNPLSRKEAERHLSILGLEGSLYQPVRELSGGMRRRVALARAILYGGDLILLDEAFKGLDAQTRHIAREYVKRYTQGKTVVAVTHEEEEARFWGGRLIRLSAPVSYTSPTTVEG